MQGLWPQDKGDNMEPYQYWTVAGFLFLLLELLSLRSLPLALSGAALFSAVIAYKYPDAYLMQALTCFVFIPIIFSAIKPYVRKKRDKNEHK